MAGNVAGECVVVLVAFAVYRCYETASSSTGLKLNDACTINAECEHIDHASCQDNLCRCKATAHYYGTNGTYLCKLITIGMGCTFFNEVICGVISNGQCNPTTFVCECQTGYSANFGDTVCIKNS